MGEAREVRCGRKQLEAKNRVIIHQESLREATGMYGRLLLLSQRVNLIPWQVSSASILKEKWGMKQKKSRITRNIQGLAGTGEDKPVYSHCFEPWWQRLSIEGPNSLLIELYRSLALDSGKLREEIQRGLRFQLLLTSAPYHHWRLLTGWGTRSAAMCVSCRGAWRLTQTLKV